VANPTALILSAAMMLQYVGERDAARRIEAAVEKVYATSDVRTPDLDGDATTEAFTAAVIAAL
jgi:homoisocitrate dehydrogenase